MRGDIDKRREINKREEETWIDREGGKEEIKQHCDKQYRMVTLRKQRGVCSSLLLSGECVCVQYVIVCVCVKTPPVSKTGKAMKKYK